MYGSPKRFSLNRIFLIIFFSYYKMRTEYIVIGLLLLAIVILGVYLVVRKSRKEKFNEEPKVIITSDPRDITGKPLGNGFKFWTNYHGENFDNINDPRNQPGPCFWKTSNAFIGTDFELHLLLDKNVNQYQTWGSAEAVLMTDKPLDYGTYWFTVQFVGEDPGAGAYNWPLDSNGNVIYGPDGKPAGDFNTTFGAFTYKYDGTPTSGSGQCYPNICHEIDMVEWGKSRIPNNVGVAQWGVQPWYGCVDPPTPTKCVPTNKLDPSRIVRWAEFTQADWDELGKQKNNITFKMVWQKGKPIEFYANPGDFGPQPWKSFPLNPRWMQVLDQSQAMFTPEVDENTRLHFNLWAPVCGCLIGNNQPVAMGPADGKAKEVIVKNIAVPLKS